MSTSSPSHRLPVLAAALAALSLAGCAAVELNRRHPGAIANGNFAPARAAATHFGASAAATCPVGGAYGVTVEKVAKLASDRGSTPAVMDGQLCSIAEAMLGWTEEGNPRDGVRTFMARYFGSISVGPQVIISTLETEDSRVIADAVAPTISQFANQAPNAHWGLATERLGTKKTKVVTVLDDVRVALDPLPRRLELGQRATLSGKLQGDLENPKVVISDARGKVTEGAVQPGKAFKAEVACDDQSGTIVVEIRGEDMGNEVALSEFKVACGGPALAGSVPVKAPAWPEETAQQEARIAEMIDAERAAAGVGKLTWSAPVGKIARAVGRGAP